MELPRFTTLRVRLSPAKATRRQLDTLDHLIVVLRKRPAGKLSA